MPKAALLLCDEAALDIKSTSISNTCDIFYKVKLITERRKTEKEADENVIN